MNHPATRSVIILLGILLLCLGCRRKPAPIPPTALPSYVAKFHLTVESALIADKQANGRSWDVGGGLPDPYVIVWVHDSKTGKQLDYGKTEVCKDTLNPTWNKLVATVKVGDRIKLETWDRDVAKDDIIGRHEFDLTQEQLDRGTVKLAFQQVRELTLVLKSLKPGDDDQIKIIPAESADERLFLMHLLEQMYSEWAVDGSSKDRLQQGLRELRHRANRLHEYLLRKNLDPNLTAAYKDLLTAIDAYTTLLVALGKIDLKMMSQADRDEADSLSRSLSVGGGVFTALAAGGVSLPLALPGAVGAGLVAYFVDDQRKERIRDEARRLQRYEAFEDYERKLSDCLARAQVTSMELASKYGWNKGEAGFNEPRERPKKVAELLCRKL